MEVGDGTKSVDYCNIVNEKNKGQQKKVFGWQGKNKWSAEDVENSEDFIDDPTVPALIWIISNFSNKSLFNIFSYFIIITNSTLFF